MKKFKIGDKVILYRKNNWNGWIFSMNKFLDRELTICFLDRNLHNSMDLCKFKEDKDKWNFPLECCKLLKEYKTPKWKKIWRQQ